MKQEHILEVWGEFACFTRPELKVERFSYPVITPSAVRGVFDSVFCKPSRRGDKAQFRWQPTKVEMLSSPKFIALRRNEVKEKASARAIEGWMKGAEDVTPIYADGDRQSCGSDQKGRTQRQTMALKDVRYRLHAYIKPWPGMEARLPAFNAQFVRRASQGKCFCQPCLGCREFPAYFELVERGVETASPVQWDADIGLMLYDVFDLRRPGTANDKAFISLFHARVQDGVMNIPDFDSAEVLKPERGAV